jgi:hypothetical protein
MGENGSMPANALELGLRDAVVDDRHGALTKLG